MSNPNHSIIERLNALISHYEALGAQSLVALFRQQLDRLIEACNSQQGARHGVNR